MKREEGFTLIEMLAMMALMAILLTLGAFAVRNFWLTRSLRGAQEEMVTQMRSIHQRAIAESRVYGIYFRSGSSGWVVFRYTPGVAGTPPVPASCSRVTTGNFDAGVVATGIGATSFEGNAAGVSMGDAIATCLTAFGSGASNDDVVLFLPRGTATGGTVGFVNPNHDDPALQVRVLPLTGRVERV